MMGLLTKGFRLTGVITSCFGTVLALCGLADALFVGSGMAAPVSSLGAAVSVLGLTLQLDTIA